MEVLWRCFAACGINVARVRDGVKWKGEGWVKETHLHIDLDRDRDPLLQLFGFLIEVLAELSDRDSFLHWKRGKKNMEKKVVTGCFKMYELTNHSAEYYWCHIVLSEYRCLGCCQSIKASDVLTTHTNGSAVECAFVRAVFPTSVCHESYD